MDHLQQVGDLIAKLGFPIFACVILGLLGFYFGNKLINGHLDFLNTQKKYTKITSRTLKKLTDTCEEIKDNTAITKTIVERNCGRD